MGVVSKKHGFAEVLILGIVIYDKALDAADRPGVLSAHC